MPIPLPPEVSRYQRASPQQSRQAYLPQRNDETLGQDNYVFSLGWRGNVDISLCTDPQGVATYVAKYASKAEKPPARFGEKVPGTWRCHTSMTVTYRKLYTKTIGLRDFSAVEISDDVSFSQSSRFASRSIDRAGLSVFGTGLLKCWTRWRNMTGEMRTSSVLNCMGRSTAVSVCLSGRRTSTDEERRASSGSHRRWWMYDFFAGRATEILMRWKNGVG